MKVTANPDGFRQWHEVGKGQAPPADVQIVTSDGRRIAAHSTVIASASPVLEDLVYGPRKSWSSERVVRILGVPSDVVFTFLRLAYGSRLVKNAPYSRPSNASSPTCGRRRQDMAAWSPSTEGRGAMEEHGVQLMVLAHKYGMGWLKRACEVEVAMRVKPEDAVDVLQIARLCDAPRLRQKCLGVIAKDFPKVEKSDGWRFVQTNDPWLELEILQFLQQTDQRKKLWRRGREEQEMYRQLGDAMECLEHICTEGCTRVGPHDRAPPSNAKGPCTKFRTCEGLQLLIRHFVTCGRKLSSRGGACSHCKRMWQLFRLHSSLCDRSAPCKVPTCKQFKLKTKAGGKGDDATWMLLVKKVAVARAMCSWAKRKRPQQLCNSPARRCRSIE